MVLILRATLAGAFIVDSDRVGLQTRTTSAESAKARMTPAALTEARETLHLSQRELAEALGIHPNIVNRWERERAKMPPYLWLALEGIHHQRCRTYQ